MHTFPPRLNPRHAHGMSLVELLVALTLASLLAILAFNLFGITQYATRTGIERSSVIQQALAAELRLRADFASIQGPNRSGNAPAGAILIIPALRQGTLPLPNGRTVTLPLRSDQLVIFYDAQNGGLTGKGGQMVGSLIRTGVKSAQAKIWLGHVQRASGEPTSALEWSLGRQATLLADPNGAVTNTPAALETAAGLPAADPRATLSPLNSASLSSDVAAFSLEEVANWMRSLGAPSGANDAKIIGAFAVSPNNTANYSNQPVVVTQPLSDSVLDASDLLGVHRLFVAHVSEVVVQYAADLNSDGLIDTVGTTATDTTSPARFKGNIQWYPKDADVFDNTNAGRTPKVFYPGDDQARVIHLGYYQGPDLTKYTVNNWGDLTPYPAVTNPQSLPAGTYQFGDAQPTLAAYNSAMAAYAAHHNGWRPCASAPPPQSQWPQLIRIRYRLHDLDGRVASINEELAANHRDDDADGTVDNAGEARCSGIWFEHIFAIPYPRTN